MNFAFIITPNKQLHFWQQSRNTKFMVPESLHNPQIKKQRGEILLKTFKNFHVFVYIHLSEEKFQIFKKVHDAEC